MSPRPRLISGPDAIRAASRIPNPGRRPQEPVVYPWDMPGPGTVPVHEQASIAAPTQNTLTQILSYRVPDGHWFALTARLNVFTGSGLIAGSGNAIWTTDVDVPIGVTSPQGYPLQGLQAETFPVGSFADGPWPMHYGYWVFPAEAILRVKVITATAGGINAGAPNYFTSVLIGHCWPKE